MSSRETHGRILYGPFLLFDLLCGAIFLGHRWYHHPPAISGDLFPFFVACWTVIGFWLCCLLAVWVGVRIFPSS